MNNNRLFRNIDNKVIGGVASGIADYLQIDVVVVRVLFVLAVFIPVHFHIFLLYIILWMVMPSSAKRPKELQQSHEML